MTRRRRRTNSSEKMGFFDLNIPYDITESGKLSPARKKTRLKMVMKAMELGYAGIAYNHLIKGSDLSNSDMCTISLLPLSSILQAAPSLPNSVKLHRDLLCVEVNTPFRQYTRLTVVIDSLIQSAALNSGNPVLKSYDLVAVRPLNQSTFDHSCKVAEVDLIAVDFSEKVPFQMDFNTVKAAIKRGIYFEITYAHLISDVHTRKQLILNSKLLVEWTRGKNLIFSSAAASASELRGPVDVTNLSSLLGLSMKRAKAAISDNCRSLLCNAARKKQFYKNAIKVERISSSESLNPKEAWFCDVKGWDAISSGEGDLLLDAAAKLSPAPNISNLSKAIDFASIADDMAKNGFPLKDWLPSCKKLKTSKQNNAGVSKVEEMAI